MSTKERILTIRLLEKAAKHPDWTMYLDTANTSPSHDPALADDSRPAEAT